MLHKISLLLALLPLCWASCGRAMQCNQSPEEMLADAALNNNLTDLKCALEQKPDVNTKIKCYTGYTTPLGLAVAKGHLAVAQELCAAGADFLSFPMNNTTEDDMKREFCDSDDDMTRVATRYDAHGKLSNTIHFTVRGNGVLETLIKNRFAASPLPAMAQLIVDNIKQKHGEKVLAKYLSSPENGMTQAHYATALLNVGMNEIINNDDILNFAPVHSAACNGRTANLAYFLEHGVDINAPDKKGNTPLFWAFKTGHYETAGYLMQQNARIDAEDCLYAVILSHSQRCGELLLDALEKKQGRPFVVKLIAQKDCWGRNFITLMAIRRAELDDSFASNELKKKARGLESLLRKYAH